MLHLSPSLGDVERADDGFDEWDYLGTVAALGHDWNKTFKRVLVFLNRHGYILSKSYLL